MKNREINGTEEIALVTPTPVLWVRSHQCVSSSWASYQIRKIAGCACAGNAGNVFPRRRLQRKPLVSDPGMHHGTCVTHVPWCMSGSFNCGDGENVPGIPSACAPAILRIWQEAHCVATQQTHHASIKYCLHYILARLSPRGLPVGSSPCAGVGVTKPISSVPLFSQFFIIVKTHFNCEISHLYLTGVPAAQLLGHLSNMNVIRWL